MSKPVNIDAGKRIANFPPRYPAGYWEIRKEGELSVQYCKALNKYGWSRLKAIAEKTLKVCDLWDSQGVHKAEVGALDGQLYISFPMPDPRSGKVTVCIDTQEGFERALGIRLADLAEYNYAGDGQHKHEGI
jgi:hypothetical protein